MAAVSPQSGGREFLIPQQHVKRGREPAEESQPCVLRLCVFVCVCVYSPSNPVAHPFLTPVGPHIANHTANVSSGRLGCVSYNGELSPKSQLFSYAPSVKSDLHENSLVQ